MLGARSLLSVGMPSVGHLGVTSLVAEPFQSSLGSRARWDPCEAFRAGRGEEAPVGRTSRQA